MISVLASNWPERPDQAAPGSDIHQLYATLTRCQLVKDDAEREYMTVSRDLEGAEHIIGAARPGGGNWHEVAEAFAVVQVLPRFVRTAARNLRTAQDSLLSAENDLQRAWRQYTRARDESASERQLRVGGYVADVARDRERELLRLVGPPAAS